MSNYYSATGADPSLQYGISIPKKTTEEGYKGSTDNGFDWGSTASSALEYLTARQRREQAQAEAKAAAQRAGMGPIGSPSYTPFIIGGVALLAVVLLMKK